MIKMVVYEKKGIHPDVSRSTHPCIKGSKKEKTRELS